MINYARSQSCFEHNLGIIKNKIGIKSNLLK